MKNPFVAANVQKLREHGVEFVEPVSGDLASGKQGMGRLNTVEEILGRITQLLKTPKDLGGKRVVVTAGPTREYLDPVRFISNRSSGKMGYAVAEAARDRGAEVLLISGPATAAPPTGVETRHIETTLELQDALLEGFDQTDIVVMAAAVADYRPQAFSPNKIKKTTDQLNIPLEQNPDIAQALGDHKKKGQITVGFAAETNDLLENAQKKLIKKNCDLIVANDVLAEGAGFEGDTNIATLLDQRGNCEQLPLLSKREVADRILDRVVELIQEGD